MTVCTHEPWRQPSTVFLRGSSNAVFTPNVTLSRKLLRSSCLSLKYTNGQVTNTPSVLLLVSPPNFLMSANMEVASVSTQDLMHLMKRQKRGEKNIRKRKQNHLLHYGYTRNSCWKVTTLATSHMFGATKLRLLTAVRCRSTDMVDVVIASGRLVASGVNAE